MSGLLELSAEVARLERQLGLMGLQGQTANLEKQIQRDAQYRIVQDALFRARRAYEDELRCTDNDELRRLAAGGA